MHVCGYYFKYYINVEKVMFKLNDEIHIRTLIQILITGFESIKLILPSPPKNNKNKLLLLKEHLVYSVQKQKTRTTSFPFVPAFFSEQKQHTIS